MSISLLYLNFLFSEEISRERKETCDMMKRKLKKMQGMSEKYTNLKFRYEVYCKNI